MAIEIAPFGDYTGVTAGAGVTKATVNAALDNLIALIPDQQAGYSDGSGGVASPSPDFDQISPAVAEKLRVEIAALQAAITAA